MKCTMLLSGMPKLLSRLKNSTSTHLKRSFVFASGLRIANEICLLVKFEFQKHLEKGVIKSHSAFLNFPAEDILAMKTNDIQNIS